MSNLPGLFKVKASYKPTAEVESFIGEQGELFYSEGDTRLRISDGVTPGGIIISNGSQDTVNTVSPGTIEILKNGNQIVDDASRLNFIGEFELTDQGSGSVDVSLISPVGTFDGGTPATVYNETTPTLNAGGVT